MLSNLVASYQSNSKIVDHFFEHQSNSRSDLELYKLTDGEKNKVIKIKTK